jgi:Tfp pilus assembly protein FimT
MILPAGKINNKGVTLIELCIVGTILSAIFAISWPVLNRIGRKTQLETVCNDIGYTLRYARDYALTENKYYCVQFDTYNRQYWIGTKIKDDSFGQLDGSLYKKRSWPDEARLGDVTSTKVLFYPDGTSEDFKITFKNSFGDVYSLTLQGSTGRIFVIDNTF